MREKLANLIAAYVESEPVQSARAFDEVALTFRSAPSEVREAVLRDAESEIRVLERSDLPRLNGYAERLRELMARLGRSD